MRFDQDTIKRCHSYILPAVSGSQCVGIFWGDESRGGMILKAIEIELNKRQVLAKSIT